MESHKRSLFKTLSWRVIALTITATIAWIVTEEWRFAVAIGGTDTLVKLFVYYLHERTWNRIDLGRNSLQATAK